jgi:hypothetical protein
MHTTVFISGVRNVRQIAPAPIDILSDHEVRVWDWGWAIQNNKIKIKILKIQNVY